MGFYKGYAIRKKSNSGEFMAMVESNLVVLCHEEMTIRQI
jgi:hypothetical protein